MSNYARRAYPTSLVGRFKVDFETILSVVRSSAQTLAAIAEHPNLLVLRYEDGFTESRDTLRLIASHLRIRLVGADQNAIFDDHLKTAVQQTIEDLLRRGVIADGAPMSVWDPRTHWHPSHVGDGRIGKWREVLTTDQAEKTLHATRGFCQTFGYAISI